jgi:hypothetical protein
MHGYSATKYEASAVESTEILRRQFGRSYDQKKFVTPLTAVFTPLAWQPSAHSHFV